MATIVGDAIGVTHPLEPLSVEEIAAAVNIVRAQRMLGERVRFVTITQGRCTRVQAGSGH
jgi:Cu2+-containing amine oxidase